MKIFCLLCLTFILLFGCAERDETPALSFNVVDSLLQPEVKNNKLGIRFRVPKNWQPLAENLHTNLQRQYDQKYGKSSKFKLDIRSVYYFREDEALLSICSLPNLRNITAFAEVIEIFRQHISADTSSKTVKTGEFHHNGLHFYQMLKMDDRMVNFKLIFRHAEGQFIQFDYIVARQVYVKNSPLIESSIGSIKALDIE